MGHLTKTILNSLYAVLLLPKANAGVTALLTAGAKDHESSKAQWKHHRPTPTQDIARRLPNGTWDSHMHIVDPTRYQLAPDAAYTPAVHTVWDAVTFENTVSMKNIVVVQPSIYGNDNSALLDALRGLGSRSRGVVVFNASQIDNATLQSWHKLGVRGVRLNLASTDASPDPDAFRRTVQEYAAVVKPFGWVVQIYMSMAQIPTLESTIRDLDVKFVFDHFAQPSSNQTSPAGAFDPYSIEGFSTFVRLLRSGKTWVKFSAPYRVNLKPDQLDALAREILRIRSDRVIFATDWPHTRFEGLDIKPFEQRCLEWAEEAGSVQKVFSTNAKALWGI